jgi:hypothetical protein
MTHQPAPDTTLPLAGFPAAGFPAVSPRAACAAPRTPVRAAP